MSDAPKAVFLSYAREDTDAARRIAEALRGFGVEVWFDQAELRGGDAWDAKIKKQIRECALFIPIISATTQARDEGYFRREWKLAVDRMQDMGGNRAFIVPVVIDDTKEAGADVPEEFMRYQWTRLAGGAPTPQFVEQIKRLLESPRKPPAPAAAATAAAPVAAQPAAASRLPLVLGAIALIAVGVAVFSFLRPAAKETVPANPAAAAKPAPAAPQASDKSIAVLPFENRSEDKSNAYFADGIHEDILTNLAHIAELRVVSRTSVMEYRGTTKKVRQIGQELGVAWLLEGSVQRAGNKVRVTGQLINARTDQHVWAQSYDRDLTDIFTIQTALAQEIARALSAALSPEEKNLLERRPTTNPAAYELLLKARQIDRNGNDTREELLAQEALLKQATEMDPDFAEAWARLSAAHTLMRFNNMDLTPARLDQARAAIETAQRLAPDHPEVLIGLGSYYYYGLRDYPRALEQFGRIARQWPNHYYGHFLTGLVQRRQGRWLESLASLRRASALDPASPEQARNLMVSLRAMRRYDDAIAEQARRVRLLPESLRESFELARLHFMARGSTREGDELLAGPIAARAKAAEAAGYRKHWATLKGDLATAARLEREAPGEWGEVIGNNVGAPWRAAVLLAAQGDLAAARARVEAVPAELRARLVNEPENIALWNNLALTESLLGHKGEALAAARQSLEIVPESRDSLVGTTGRWALAVALAWTGDKEAACRELGRLLAEPSVVNVHEIRSAPWLFPLKGYPAFEALLTDPKNNQPLF
ncbi:MAG: TIR domain-containing protein [Opitutae bacterium]|nr:TIR domain-containing protein [Opitutae bacterium]